MGLGAVSRAPTSSGALSWRRISVRDGKSRARIFLCRLGSLCPPADEYFPARLPHPDPPIGEVSRGGSAVPALYLSGGAETRIRVDGPSFLVEKPTEAGRRYPFERVTHIVVRGRIRLSWDFLSACGCVGIPVSFFTADGAPIAQLLPSSVTASSNQRRLEDFLEHP